MSKERCEATKQLMKQAIAILQSGAAGQGRGVSLAITYMEDAYLRVDFHMREQGWVTPSNGAKQATVAMSPQNMAAASQPAPLPRVNTLKPAATIPQLNTGLMSNPVVKTDSETRAPRQQDFLEDMDLL